MPQQISPDAVIARLAQQVAALSVEVAKRDVLIEAQARQIESMSQKAPDA